MSNEPLRILIVDDHPLVRKGLLALLSSMPDLVVVGEAANGKEAITQARELQPDIILMDLDMPELNGIEATRQITQANPRTGILVAHDARRRCLSLRCDAGRRARLPSQGS
jgi:DNA-binding NarL/FixJ family response regulator